MDNKHKILLAVGLTAIITDMLPTPADYFVFKAEQSNKSLLEQKKITPKQYWERSAGWYYLANPLYWAIVTLIVFNIKNDFDTKVKVGIGVISIGAVLGIISKNIKKDEQLISGNK